MWVTHAEIDGKPTFCVEGALLLKFFFAEDVDERVETWRKLWPIGVFPAASRGVFGLDMMYEALKEREV